MLVPVSNRALLRSLAASVLVLAGATACSRSDRSESGSDNSASMTQDTTTASPSTQDSSESSQAPSDTAAVDSTEILGNVTSYETADEEPVSASE